MPYFFYLLPYLSSCNLEVKLSLTSLLGKPLAIVTKKLNLESSPRFAGGGSDDFFLEHFTFFDKHKNCYKIWIETEKDWLPGYELNTKKKEKIIYKLFDKYNRAKITHIKLIVFNPGRIEALGYHKSQDIGGILSECLSLKEKTCFYEDQKSNKIFRIQTTSGDIYDFTLKGDLGDHTNEGILKNSTPKFLEIQSRFSVDAPFCY